MYFAKITTVGRKISHGNLSCSPFNIDRADQCLYCITQLQQECSGLFMLVQGSLVYS